MIKMIIGGVAAAALLSGLALAAPARTPSPKAPPARTPGARAQAAAPTWVVIPTETGCRMDLELTARSGAITPVSLLSDGQLVSLKFFKEDLPARAFLPIRVDRARFSNLMLRGDAGAGELVLSEETEAAMRKGSTLSVAWLTEEPLSASLGGSEQGLLDLRVCGAQTAQRHRDHATADLVARDRAQAEARAKAVTDAQLAAIQAQAAAADAQRRQVEQASERQRLADAEAAAERQRRADAAVQSQAYEEARQRAYDDPAARRRAYERQIEDEEDDAYDRWAPPPRPYYPPPYPPVRRYERY